MCPPLSRLGLLNSLAGQGALCWQPVLAAPAWVSAPANSLTQNIWVQTLLMHEDSVYPISLLYTCNHFILIKWDWLGEGVKYNNTPCHSVSNIQNCGGQENRVSVDQTWLSFHQDLVNRALWSVSSINEHLNDHLALPWNDVMVSNSCISPFLWQPDLLNWNGCVT